MMLFSVKSFSFACLDVGALEKKCGIWKGKTLKASYCSLQKSFFTQNQRFLISELKSFIMEWVLIYAQLRQSSKNFKNFYWVVRFLSSALILHKLVLIPILDFWAPSSKISDFVFWKTFWGYSSYLSKHYTYDMVFSLRVIICVVNVVMKAESNLDWSKSVILWCGCTCALLTLFHSIEKRNRE